MTCGVSAAAPWRHCFSDTFGESREEFIIDIKALRAFVHIARVGSFTRAAAELYIAQPALSRQIAKLEEELATSLFVRYGRGVRLTNAGARLLERAEMILQYVTQTAQIIQSSDTDLRGHIALGMPPAVGVRLAAPIAKTFKENWPGVAIHLREGLSNSLQEWLLDKRADVAVLYNQPPIDAFDVELLCSEDMAIIAPPFDLSAVRNAVLDSDQAPPVDPAGAASGRGRGRGAERIPTIRIRDIADLPLIVPGLPHANRRLLEQAAIQHGVHLRVAMEVDSVALTKSLVMQGLGYSMLTLSAALADVRRGKLRAYRIAQPALKSTISLAILREQRAVRLVQTMSETVRTHLHELVIRGEWRDRVKWVAMES